MTLIMAEAEIKKFGLPDSIKEFEAPKDFHKNNEYNYDAYQYQFDLLEDVVPDEPVLRTIPKGMWMKGAHKGVLDGEYHTSCLNKDFWKIYQSSNPVLKLTVYNPVKANNAWLVVKQAEYVELTELNAKQDDMSWNGSNGFPVYKTIRRTLCNAILNELTVDKPYGEGKYDVKQEPISIHVSMATLQVRAAWDGEFVSNITVLIDDEGGSNKNTDRVVVWEDRAVDGTDLRGDGNQTVQGIANTNNGKLGVAMVKVARIPYEIHKNLSDNELRHIGNMLNKRKLKIYKPTDVLDGAKMILDLMDDGAPMKCPEHDLILTKDYGLNSKKRKQAYAEVEDVLFEKKEILKHRTLADYSLPHLAPLKIAKLEELRKETDTLVIPVTVKMGFKWFDLIATSIRNDEKLAKDNSELFIIKKVQLLLDYRQSKALRTDFRNNLWPDFKTKFNAFTSDFELVDYEEMDLTIPDTTPTQPTQPMQIAA